VETTEKIVEAYVRYVKGWATIANIKCPGQYEIDLLAIDPVAGGRYHIESTVSVSGAYSKLTAKPYSAELLKQRVKVAGQRRTIGYFAQRKFSAPGVKKTLKRYGFEKGNYEKIIVTWSATEDARKKAEKLNIKLWYFPELMKHIRDEIKDGKTYFVDDTLRTLHLFDKALKV